MMCMLIILQVKIKFKPKFSFFLFPASPNYSWIRARRQRGTARGGPMSPVWILNRLVLVFINVCCLLSALSSLSQFGWGRLSLVVISFYALLLLFGPCCLLEFTLGGPRKKEIHNQPRLQNFILNLILTCNIYILIVQTIFI